jgi:hypothetical protein
MVPDADAQHSTVPGPTASRADIRAWLLAEEQRPIVGWDFGPLAGRRVTERPAPRWDYTTTVAALAANAGSMLDLDTGGGERLAELTRRSTQAVATEAYAPNIPLAARRLAPLGVSVVAARADGPLPFVNAAFALVTNRHGAYRPTEIARILQFGGSFVTQQVGWQTNLELYDVLGRPRPPVPPQSRRWKLRTAIQQLTEVGLSVLTADEEHLMTCYADVGALVIYLKAVAWQIPDFDIDRDLDRLLALHRQIVAEGPLMVRFHQFFVQVRREPPSA